MGSTEASWQDVEAGQGSIQPLKLEPPTMVSCQSAVTVVLLPSIKVTWRVPVAYPDNVIVQGYLNGVAVNMGSTTVDDGVYTLTVFGG
ncbi:hypothetical protein ACFQZB_07590 [Arthrobacter ulcerisalmonis]